MTQTAPSEAARARFLALLDAFGADPKRWPATQAEALADLWAVPELQPAIAEARALDSLLGAEPEGQLNPAFVARIADAARRRPYRQGWGPVAALAACALVGIGIGARLGPELWVPVGPDPVVWAEEMVVGWEEGG